MTIFLVSNNLVLNDLNYESRASVDEKRENRPLSIAGERLGMYLSKVLKINDIYASTFASAMATAKYMAQVSQTMINVSSQLNDLKIGNMGRHNIKMLRFMQDKNFDYKYPDGESLNEGKVRMSKIIGEISKKNTDAIVFTHRRAMMAFLLNYCEPGYNLDEKLILSYHDKVILGDTENDLDMVKIVIEDHKIRDIDYVEIEG